MDDTREPGTGADGDNLPTRRELREAEEASVRNDLGVSGPDAEVPGDDAAVEGDYDPSAQPVDEMDEARTEVLDPVGDGASQTAVMDPVEVDGAAEVPAENDRADAAEEPSTERNWMGVAGFVAALLALSPIAIILGHLGLSAAKKGKATNRSVSLAAAILGWIALIATAVGVWAYLQGPPAAQIDVYAQEDIHAVGAEVATQAVETGDMPVLADSGTEYTVGDVTIPSALEGAHEMTLTGSAPATWCLDLTYEGGENDAYSYLPTEGVVEGACR